MIFAVQEPARHEADAKPRLHLADAKRLRRRWIAIHRARRGLRPRWNRDLAIPIRRSIEIAPHPRVRAGNGQCRETCMANRDIRAALNEHWAASDANDFELEHQIYREDAVLEYPQSGERIRGRRNIQTTRSLQPSRKRFKVRRVVGTGDLWVTEYVILYDGKPSYTVSIMEFEGGKVARETQYFGDPFEASAWRSRWVEPMDKGAKPFVES
jgi:hypothetical protein